MNKQLLLLSSSLFLAVGCTKTYVTIPPPSQTIVRDSINNDTVSFAYNSSVQYKSVESKNNVFYLDASNAIAGNEATLIVGTSENSYTRAYNSGVVYGNSFHSIYNSYLVIKIKYLGLVDNIPTFTVEYTNPKP